MKMSYWSSVVAAVVVVLVGVGVTALVADGESPAQEKDHWKVALVVYDHVELLDLAGPGEVFAAGGSRFEVYTVAETKEPIISQGFLTIVPEYSIADAPMPDILVVPGGGTRGIRTREEMMAWIERAGRGAEVTLSVCTGAFILGDAGLLEGAEATTYSAYNDSLREAFPDTLVHEGVRWVDSGDVVTTAGVSAGIDGALHVMSKLLGPEAATSIAGGIEYDKWVAEEGHIVDSPVNRTYRERETERKEDERMAAVEVPVVDGVQQIKVVVGDNGYEPSALRLHRGVPARLIFERRTESSCAARVKIPDFGVAPRELELNAETVVEFTPDKAGRYSFTCGMDMIRGALLIEAS